jgi:hypothetical protein
MADTKIYGFCDHKCKHEVEHKETLDDRNYNTGMALSSVGSVHWSVHKMLTDMTALLVSLHSSLQTLNTDENGEFMSDFMVDYADKISGLQSQLTNISNAMAKADEYEAALDYYNKSGSGA